MEILDALQLFLIYGESLPRKMFSNSNSLEILRSQIPPLKKNNEIMLLQATKSANFYVGQSVKIPLHSELL